MRLFPLVIQTSDKPKGTKRLKFIVGLVISSYIKPVQMTVKNNYGRGEKSKLFETRQLKRDEAEARQHVLFGIVG